jgi:ribonuclease P protein component
MIKSLQKKSDFARVAKFGQPFFASELGFKIVKNNLNKNRYGIVVSLEIDKRATVRNQIRRRIKEVARLNDQNLKQGFDLMFLVRESVKDLKYKEIEEKLNFLFKKAGLS